MTTAPAPTTVDLESLEAAFAAPAFDSTGISSLLRDPSAATVLDAPRAKTDLRDRVAMALLAMLVVGFLALVAIALVD